MDTGSNVMEIILRARDDASTIIQNVGKNIDSTSKQVANFQMAFVIAGAAVTAVGIAGVGVLKNLGDAGASYQTAMASVDTTLQNVASSFGTVTQVVGGNTGAVGENKKAVQEQIKALELQKQQLQLNNAETTQAVTVTTGHGNTLKDHTKIIHQDAAETKTQVEAIDQQILSLKEQELGINKSATATSAHTIVTNNLSMSFDSLKKTVDAVAESYLKLGFNDTETQLSFAQDLRVTKDVTNAKVMLSAAADLARLKHVQLSEATTLLSQAYAGNERALKSLGIEVQKGAKGMEVINLVEQAAGGQAQAFSQTYQGAMAALSASTEHLKETLGVRLLPSMMGFADQITKLIDKLNNLDPAVYDTIINVLKFGTGFALVVGPLLLVIGLLPTLAAGVGIIAPVILPLILIFAAVAAAAVLLYSNWDQIQTLIKANLVPALSQLQAIWQSLTNFWVNVALPVVQAVLTKLSQFWIEVQPKLIAAFQAISQRIMPIVEGISQFIIAHWDQIKVALEVVMGIIGTIVIVGFEAIKAVIMIALDVISGNWKGVWDDILGFFTGIWNDMNAMTGGALDKLKNSITGTFTSIGATIHSIVQGIVNDIKNMINSAIDAINHLIDGANSLAGKVPGVSGNIKIPTIPRFDQGGFMPYTGLAMLHQGEFVMSNAMLSGKQQVPGQVFNRNQAVNINVASVNSPTDWSALGAQLSWRLRNIR